MHPKTHPLCVARSSCQLDIHPGAQQSWNILLLLDQRPIKSVYNFIIYNNNIVKMMLMIAQRAN